MKKATSRRLRSDLFFVARPERFERPTPWFVAKYSIQLSYGRAVKKTPSFFKLVLLARPERFERPTPWFVAKYSIQLSYGRAVRAAHYTCSSVECKGFSGKTGL